MDIVLPSKEDFVLASTPSGYATIRLGQKLYPWQIEVIDSLEQPHTRCALRTCNESGKTSVCIASLILWHMECFPGSLCVTTSASNKQIKFQLYPQLKRMTARWKDWNVRDSNEYSVKAPNGSMCVSYSTDDPNLIEGFHEWKSGNFYADWQPPEDWGEDFVPPTETPLMIIVDEGKGIKDEFFNALDRCRPTRFFAASSPGEPIGRFYDFFYTWKERFKREEDGGFNLFSASYTDCPHLTEDPHKRRWIEQDIMLRGRDDAFVRSSAYGEFAQSGGNMVFDMRRVDESMSGMIQPVDQLTVRGAVDLSGGGDETCFYIRKGNRAELDYVSHESDAIQLAEDLMQRFDMAGFKSTCAYHIKVDEGSLGDPICDYFARKGWEVERIQFGSKSKNPDKYLNKRAEMYFELAQNINRGNIILPRDDKLREQLGWQSYKLDEGQKVSLTKKKYMPHSPDRADTVAMLFYDMPEIKDFQEQIELNRRFLSPTLPNEIRTGLKVNPHEETPEEAMLF